MRFAFTAAAIVFLAAGPPAALQQPSESPVFRGSVQSIEVDVRGTDRDGRVVRELTRDDFTLLEDGKPQTIVTSSFIDLEVESPIRRMIPGGIDSDVATNAGIGRMWVILLGSSAGSGSAQGPLPLASPGRAVGRQADTSDYLFQRDALAAATRNNVAIYVVSTTGIDTGLDRLAAETGEPRQSGRVLTGQAGQQVLADETGGDSIVNTNNYREGYERFVRDSNQYYLLGYTPQVEHRDGEFHRVTVRVNRPGLTVRARTGYYAPSRERPPARQVNAGKNAPKEKLSPAAVEALRMPLSMGGLTLDPLAAPFRGKGNVASVLVGAQVHGSGLVLNRGEKIEVGFVGTTSEGKTSPGHPTAARTFSRRDALTAYAEVYTSSDPKVTEVAAQITRAGENRPRVYPVAPFSPAPGQMVLRRLFPLREFEPDDYILTFEARAEKRTASRRVLFTVVDR